MPAPSPARVPLKGNNTLCGEIIGSTNGIISLYNFINPIREYKRGDLYEVFLTKKGATEMAKKRPDVSLYRDRGYWQAFFRGYELKMCKHCQESEEYALLILAEV